MVELIAQVCYIMDHVHPPLENQQRTWKWKWKEFACYVKGVGIELTLFLYIQKRLLRTKLGISCCFFPQGVKVKTQNPTAPPAKKTSNTLIEFDAKKQVNQTFFSHSGVFLSVQIARLANLISNEIKDKRRKKSQARL